MAKLLTEKDAALARQWREEGKQAWLHGRSECPYNEGTFSHHCWKAGYHQHVANEQELWNEFYGDHWRKTHDAPH